MIHIKCCRSIALKLLIISNNVSDKSFSVREGHHTGLPYFLSVHYWANRNPRWMISVPFQHPWSVTYWCGIVGDHVIGPNLFEGPLTGQVYANFLQNVLPQLMEDVPSHVCINMWMQHEGAPHHHVLYSRQVMNEIFDEKWIGRGGPVA